MTALLAALSLDAGFNTAVVMLGAAALGAAAGTVGVFAMLRRQALLGDAVAHATLPGVALGFLAALALGLPGRSFGPILAGAAATAVIAALAVAAIKSRTRLPEDAAIATVLAGFFAAGVVLLSVIQTLPTGGQAGLDAYLIGSVAGMLALEAISLAALAAVAIALVALVFKELAAVAFDAEHAASEGLPVAQIDLILVGLVVLVVVAGLRTVGLVLVVAMLVIPPAAARFCTDRLGRLTALSAAIGAASAYVGAAISAAVPDAPAGPVIVLVAFTLFVLGFLFGPARGLVPRRLGARG